jgi:NADPH-dependent 2,4-dienoyl-CoA reductase/sulfur reductase-like enzyme/rhodanese-related sulfurtransferase
VNPSPSPQQNPEVAARRARYVIVGGVAGGMSAATRLRRLDPWAEIVVLERSAHVSYANCGLPYFVGGVIEDEEDLFVQTPERLFARFRLDVRVANEAVAVDAARRVVTARELSSGREYELPYDRLILSPGATPVVPALPGVERAHAVRTVEDVERIAAVLEGPVTSAVVVGGGFIGVEIAENLVHRGLRTAVVEATGQLLAPLDVEMASYVADEMRRHGVELHLNAMVSALGAESVVLDDGTALDADLVVLAIGVRPETALARATGLAIGPRGGVLVDDDGRTSDPFIYAVGDAAEKRDALDLAATLVPLANVANRQGRVLADHLCGRATRHVPSQATAIVKVFDLVAATTGWNEKRLAAAGHAFQALHTHGTSHAGYYPGARPMALKLLVEPATGRILGAQAVGTEGVDKRIDVLATAMRGGLRAEALADLELAYAPPFGSAKDPVNVLGYVAENVLSGLEATIQWHEVEGRRARGDALVDVRDPEEFARGTIPGAINVPLDELRERVGDLGAGPVLVVCAGGQRGHVATQWLRAQGVAVANLDGGYETWRHSPAAEVADSLV